MLFRGRPGCLSGGSALTIKEQERSGMKMSCPADRSKCFLGFPSEAYLSPASFSVHKPWAITYPFLIWQNAFGGCADGLGMKSTRGFALRRDLHVSTMISWLPQAPTMCPVSPVLLQAGGSGVPFIMAC